MKRGTLVTLVNRRCFKLGIVLGPSRTHGKLRICVWSANSRCWSGPATISEEFVADATAVDSRQRGIIGSAMRSALYDRLRGGYQVA